MIGAWRYLHLSHLIIKLNRVISHNCSFLVQCTWICISFSLYIYNVKINWNTIKIVTKTILTRFLTRKKNTWITFKFFSSCVCGMACPTLFIRILLYSTNFCWWQKKKLSKFEYNAKKILNCSNTYTQKFKNYFLIQSICWKYEEIVCRALFCLFSLKNIIKNNVVSSDNTIDSKRKYKFW